MSSREWLRDGVWWSWGGGAVTPASATGCSSLHPIGPSRASALTPGIKAPRNPKSVFLGNRRIHFRPLATASGAPARLWGALSLWTASGEKAKAASKKTLYSSCLSSLAVKSVESLHGLCVCWTEGKAPERPGTETCPDVHLEGKTFLCQKQYKVGEESKGGRERGKSDGFQTRGSLAGS